MNQIESFYGIIDSTADALRVFELCRQGKLGRVRRRLHEKERHLIRSGSVFVFDEKESGIRRWTDGRVWSPSRILGNFLIYRELDKKVSSNGAAGASKSYSEAGSVLTTVEGEQEDEEDLYVPKKRMQFSATSRHNQTLQALTPSALALLNPSVALAADKSTSFGSAALSGEQFGLFSAASSTMGVQFPSQPPLGCGGFKKFSFSKNGLIKKTISVTIGEHVHHLICYYSKKDFDASALLDISSEAQEAVTKLANELQMVTIGEDLLNKQSFRKPEAEDIYKRSSLLEDNDPDEHDIYSQRRPISPVSSGVSRPLHAAKQFRSATENSNGAFSLMNATAPIELRGAPGHDDHGNAKGHYRYNLQSSDFQLMPSNRGPSFAQPLLCPAAIQPVNGGSSSLYQGILQPTNDLNGIGLFNASSASRVMQHGKPAISSNEGVLSEIENEFGHIAATLSKLTSSSFSSVGAVASPVATTGILPPITGESYTGSLPSLNLMDMKSNDLIADSSGASFSFSDPHLTANFSEQILVAHQQEDSVSQSANLTQLLSMPLFPREDALSSVLPEDEYNRNEHSTNRMKMLSLAASVEKQRRYEEKLKETLFGAQCN